MEPGDLWLWVQQAFQFLIGQIGYVLSLISYVWQVLVTVANYLWNAALWIVGKIVAGFQALTHLPFSTLWNKIKKIYDQYRRFRKWWQAHIQGPLDAYRKQVLAIYRQFFKPIISVIEAARSAVRIIAVFNRKLAAKLDAKLWALEGWILTPITRALRAVNGMASIIYAILTITGRLDGTVFIATVCRHIGEIRAALFGLPWSNKNLPADTRPERNAQIAADFKNWLQSGGGYIQDGVDTMTAEFQDAMTLMGEKYG
jgi:hypothetical protein